jgi:hypothetical protein
VFCEVEIVKHLIFVSKFYKFYLTALKAFQKVYFILVFKMDCFKLASVISCCQKWQGQVLALGKLAHLRSKNALHGMSYLAGE